MSGARICEPAPAASGWISGQAWPSVRRSGQRSPIPHHVRVMVYGRDGHACQQCGPVGPGAGLHLDHVRPWSAGGSDASSNLRPLCGACNLDRGVTYSPADQRRILPCAPTCIDCSPSLEEYAAILSEQMLPGGDLRMLAHCWRCSTSGYAPIVAMDACIWGGRSDRCHCGMGLMSAARIDRYRPDMLAMIATAKGDA